MGKKSPGINGLVLARLVTPYGISWFAVKTNWNVCYRLKRRAAGQFFVPTPNSQNNTGLSCDIIRSIRFETLPPKKIEFHLFILFYLIRLNTPPSLLRSA